MMTNWERRIRHIDRRVKPTAMCGLRGRMMKEKVKQRRGLQSRNLSAELVFKRVAIEFRNRADSGDAAVRLARIQRIEIHERLMERKRSQRSAARRRARPSSEDTCIYLLRRRPQWLRDVERSADARC